MKIIFSFLAICLTIAQPFAQTSSTIDTSLPAKVYLADLFGSNQTYAAITEQADTYFAMKYPDLTPADLCVGEFRDGAFVKYQRWSSFWKNHLNEDGTLGDFTKYAQGMDRAAECDDSDFAVDWENISYNSNMGWQIDQGRTSSIAFHPTDPNTYYVGAAWGGLWKTTDGGLTHTIVNDDLPLAAVGGIIIDPEDTDRILVALSDIVWYGPGGIGIYISNDGGVTFEATDLTWELRNDKRIYYLDQNPSDGESVMAATANGLYKSEDFFATNERVLEGSFHSVKYSRTDPNIVYAGERSGEFYRSEDGGDSFELIQDFGGSDVRIAVSLMEGSERVVATSAGNLYTSIDNGLTFATKVLPESNMVIEFSPGNDDVLNVGNFEVHQSTDFGDSFEPVTQWLGADGLPFIHVDQRNVFVNPLVDNQVYFCNDGGVFRQHTITNTFANLSTDLLITQFYDIAVSQTETEVLGGGSQDNGNVFRGEDSEWWRYAETGDGMGQDIDPSDAGVRYWAYQFGAIRRWEDGENVDIQPEGESGSWEAPFKLDPSNSDRLLIGYTSVYVSEDNGDTWETLGDPVLGGGADLDQLAIAPSNPDKVYVSRGSSLYVKEAGLEAWEFIRTPYFGSITDLEVDHLNEDIIYISYGGYSNERKVYMSEDGGENWTNLSDGLPNLPVMSLELYENKPGGVFIGTYGAVYYRDSTMTEWEKFGCLPNTSVNDIEIQYFTNRIFIGTHGRGMYGADIPFGDFAGLSELVNEQSEIELYPNPARNYITIKSTEIDLATAEIMLTDVSGRSIDVSHFNNSSNEITMDCTRLLQGNYFVVILDNANKKHVLKLSKI
ncbi:T9SS type A sorting domain-containing protein [Crocinitomix catalasitica]|uniref:T9SS type A sorting domain-containing protein n=1 Tax=Crocinitomix catalasitica TaxID=184607 RepID=UPI00146FC3ED|nr:T9SS type A sorting domain-containing protein [Crocinitomix catalasitica]